MKTLAIIVNYKSAALTQKAVQSVLDSASLGPVQVAVVDNSEDNREEERLRLSLPSVVALRISPENIGFGRACNLVFEQFEGDQILLINPDARLLPGCLLRLQKTLSSIEKAGAVSSHIFWDDKLKFYLPSSYPPPLYELQAVLDSLGPQSRINRLLSEMWRYHSVKVWRARKPVKVMNLSGGLVLLKREAVVKSGGLFDPRFFLYFEDTDLFIRLKAAGYSLVVEPRAKAIHYYDQCGQEDSERKRFLMAKSHKEFLEKHHKRLRSRMTKVLALLKPPGLKARGCSAANDFTSPFVLEAPVQLHEGWLFEWSPNPTFIPSSIRFGEGPLIEFPQECWAMLAPGRYFARIGDAAVLGRYRRVISWVVEK